ncbi:MAG: SH3 domain-containing protein [Anaerolineae bacterium]
MRTRFSVLMFALVMILSACNLSASNSQPIPGTAQSGKPSVQIISPQDSSEVIVNTRVLVSVTATDTVGVTRAQLFADGQVVKTVSSESAGGEQTFNAVLDFTPRAAGDIEIEVIAYRASIASDPARIRLVVRENQSQVTATPIIVPQTNVPIITPNDPTCRVVTQTNLNERTGPDTAYPVLRVLPAGSVLPIIGRIASNQWWQVRDGTVFGWVSGAFVLVYGNCALIPIVPAPPPPPTFTSLPVTLTPTPTPTSTPPTPTVTSGPSDLVVASIVGNQNVTLGAGNTPITASYAITVSNTGQSPTGQFANTILVQPGGSEEQLGVVAGLNPGDDPAAKGHHLHYPGVYTITARADSSNAVSSSAK